MKSPTSAGETGMAISFESSDEKRLERLHRMSDEELIRFGKAARSLCRDPRARETFQHQLEEARAEWRRRYPRADRTFT